MKKKLAFSLIELSIVILVIAFLMLGALKGGQMVNKGKTVSAARMTKASIVGKMDDLVLWLETTRSESFDEEEASNGEEISNWYDISDSSLVEYQASQGDAANQPVYSKNSINNLPSLEFDGNDFMNVADGFDQNAETITIFVIVKPSGASGVLNCLLEKSDGSSPYPYSLRANTSYTLEASGGNTPFVAGVTQRQAGIAYVVSARKVKGGLMHLWINGVSEGGDVIDNTTTGANSEDLTIGCRGDGATGCLTGNIGEIIIFSRALIDEERQDVEKYLSAKWGIEI
ncbi:MAG: type II secretory pathway pseudopilin PulG [Lentimonas sp.]|jgi:type II secretory pathway pseudopilin PulG